MTLGQVLSSRSIMLSTRSRQLYWNMETHLLLKVRSYTIWSLTPTSLMSMYHWSWMQMWLVKTQELYEDYVLERISGEVSLWAPAKKENKMFMSANKKNHIETPRQDCGSKGDQGRVWQTDGPGQIQQRHQPERGHWEPRIHCNTKSSFCFGWYNPAMPEHIEVDTPQQVGNSRNSTGSRAWFRTAGPCSEKNVGALQGFKFFNWCGRPYFGENWRPFLLIARRSLGNRLFFWHTKIYCSFCGCPFLWGPCSAEHAEHA